MFPLNARTIPYCNSICEREKIILLEYPLKIIINYKIRIKIYFVQTHSSTSVMDFFPYDNLKYSWGIN